MLARLRPPKVELDVYSPRARINEEGGGEENGEYFEDAYMHTLRIVELVVMLVDTVHQR